MSPGSSSGGTSFRRSVRVVRRFAMAGVAAWTVGAVLPSPIAAQAGILAMERAAERYTRTHALCADFDQILEIRLLGKTVASSGRLCQQRPNLFSMRFTDPSGDVAIADGESFWTYYPSMSPDQAVRVPMAQSPGGYDFYSEFLEDPDSKYAIEDQGLSPVGGKQCRLVHLTPVRGAAYRRAKVWLDPETDLLCKVEVVHENGSIRTVTLQNVRLNLQLPADEFIFEPPEGVQVMRPPS